MLVVKLSSLGDVIHALPAVWDIRCAHPDAQIDWVVEPAFADVLNLSAGVDRIIDCPLRSWRKSGFDAAARQSMRKFWAELRLHSYDWVLDLQGLTKSGVVARMARVNQGGSRVAMANATNGSSYERPTAWLSSVCIQIPKELGAVDRSRYLCSKAMGYSFNSTLEFGLRSMDGVLASSPQPSKARVALITGTSRADKSWPFENWVELSRLLQERDLEVCLMHGNDAEESFAKHLLEHLPHAKLWPRLSLANLAKQMKECVGSIGVDSGPSHLCVALGMPHVQIYNFPTAWRTGPNGVEHQLSVYANPTPSVQEVWSAWQKVQIYSSLSQSVPRTQS